MCFCYKSLHKSLHSGLHLKLLDANVFTADKNGKARDSVSPAPVAPSSQRMRLTLNQLVLHKVLGKGSFGKVDLIVSVF